MRTTHQERLGPVDHELDRLGLLHLLAALLAERDARTAKLEAAIGELQSVGAAALPAGHDMSAEYDALLARFENRLEEQERSFRHVMTMLIEWLEDDEEREAA